MHICALTEQKIIGSMLRGTNANIQNHLAAIDPCFDCASALAAVLSNESYSIGDVTLTIVMQRIETIASIIVNPDQKGIIFAMMGEIYAIKQEHLLSERYYRKALQHVSNLPSTSVLAGSILVNLANIYQDRGEFAQAIQTLEQAIVSYQNSREFTGQAEAWGNLANVYQDSQEHVKAVQARLKSINLYEAVGDIAAQADGLSSLALIYADQHEYQLAIKTCQRSAALLEHGIPSGQIAQTLNNLGIILREAGEVDGALSILLIAQSLALRSNQTKLSSIILQNINSLN
ncbi:MAG: tetratricopeptide repeat protein [Ktedonobacteraceae bacterium]|nr:tetratricopeptide repeat protein [Ktedonobacteraceae bacterium]